MALLSLHSACPGAPLLLRQCLLALLAPADSDCLGLPVRVLSLLLPGLEVYVWSRGVQGALRWLSGVQNTAGRFLESWWASWWVSCVWAVLFPVRSGWVW